MSIKKNILSLIGLGIIIVSAGWLIFSNNYNRPNSEVIVYQKNIEKEVVLTINNGEEPQILTSEFISGMTAFDLLKNKAEESGLNLKTKTYDIGIMIEAIGDKENGQDGKYWMYYVNEELPMISADKKELNPGDKVEFKFEKSSFLNY
ncbi:MAG: hypothetical protein C0412_21830 [Flavobacterium sp.]|nr:hypothetical protein [Flavobacterium sp.]